MSRVPVYLRLLRLAGRHRRPLAWLMALAVVNALTIVAGAVLAARVVVTVLDGGPWPGALGLLAGVLAVRAIVARLRPGAAHAVATAVITDGRAEVPTAVARRRPGWVGGRAAG